MQARIRLEVKVVRRLLEAPRASGVGTYYCHLGRLVGGALALGADPERADAPPELHDVRWLPIAGLDGYAELARVLPLLGRGGGDADP